MNTVYAIMHVVGVGGLVHISSNFASGMVDISTSAMSDLTIKQSNFSQLNLQKQLSLVLHK